MSRDLTRTRPRSLQYVALTEDELIAGRYYVARWAYHTDAWLKTAVSSTGEMLTRDYWWPEHRAFEEAIQRLGDGRRLYVARHAAFIEALRPPLPAGPVTSRPTRARHAREAQGLRKPSCERCGDTVNLEAHHRNRNWTDNRAENIETLCSACHSSEHKRGGRSSSPQPPLSEEDLRLAGRYFVARFVRHSHRWLEIALTGQTQRSPESAAMKETKRRFNVGIDDNARLGRAYRVALLEALAPVAA